MSVVNFVASLMVIGIGIYLLVKKVKENSEK
jgi:hypothetical protein